MGIIGGNGAGKSTLFRMIMGKDKPDGGQLQLGDTVVPMYVDQSRDALDPNKTVRGAETVHSTQGKKGLAQIRMQLYCSSST